MDEPFDEKVLGITTFNGKVIVAREDGVFACGDDHVCYRIAIDLANGEDFSCDA